MLPIRSANCPRDGRQPWSSYSAAHVLQFVVVDPGQTIDAGSTFNMQLDFKGASSLSQLCDSCSALS